MISVSIISCSPAASDADGNDNRSPDPTSTSSGATSGPVRVAVHGVANVPALGHDITEDDVLDEFFDASDVHRWQRRDISTAWERIVRTDCTHVHHALGSPVVVAHADGRRTNMRVEIDPRLKDLSFGRLLGADGCYQEIDQFVGGVLANNPGIVQVSDRDRLLAYGFDPKWSFRNPEPPARKRKRRKG
jgi:hypothetical protein